MKNKQFSPNRLVVFSWILYDFANTIYSMNVVSIYFSLWITVNLAKEDLWVSAGNSISMLLVALSMPILGTLSDFLNRRVAFLFIFTLLCVVATAAIGVAGYFLQDLLLIIIAVVLFTVANYGYQGALVFYNAILPQLSPPEKIGKISGYGVAAGYLGSILGLLLVMPFAEGEISFLKIQFKDLTSPYQQIGKINASMTRFLDTSVERNPNYAYKLISAGPSATGDTTIIAISNADTVITTPEGLKQRAIIISWRALPQINPPTDWLLLRCQKGWGRLGTFVPTAVLFFLFALPIFIFIKDPHLMERSPQKVNLNFGDTLRTVWEGISNTKKHPGVLRFLIAKFFYEEGIQTAIIFMGVYAVKVMGFSSSVIIPFFMVATSAAVVGSFLFGYITDWIGPKRTLIIVIAGWIVCLTALILTTVQSYFWVIGSFIGIFMGSTWTSARPLLMTLIPKQMAGEFFGLYSLSGKMASIIGPLLWGTIVYLLGAYPDAVKYKVAVGSLGFLMFIGLILLTEVPSKEINSAIQEEEA